MQQRVIVTLIHMFRPYMAIIRVCRYAKLLYCIACHNCIWLIIGTF
jgi:hypothetical protein